jgi:hypothetical protein
MQITNRSESTNRMTASNGNTYAFVFVFPPWPSFFPCLLVLLITVLFWTWPSSPFTSSSPSDHKPSGGDRPLSTTATPAATSTHSQEPGAAASQPPNTDHEATSSSASASSSSSASLSLLERRLAQYWNEQTPLVKTRCCQNSKSNVKPNHRGGCTGKGDRKGGDKGGDKSN